MIRIVLAVVLTTALLAVAAPSAEQADRERTTALAVEELETIQHAASQLAAENDPVRPDESPASTTVVLSVPEPAFVDRGLFRLSEDELRWESPFGVNHTVDTSVPLRVETPVFVTDRVSLRLSLVRFNNRTVVSVIAVV